MKRAKALAAFSIACAIGLHTAAALARLDAGVVAGLQAQGTVLGATPETVTDQETTTPFTRSFVSVAQSGTVPDPFQYSASADIGTLELKVFGRYTNGSSSPVGNGEVPFMRVSSHARDVVTLASPSSGTFEVILNLKVDGSIVTSGGSPLLLANASLESSLVNDSRTYGLQTVDDTLSIKRILSGPTADMEVEAFLSFNVLRVDPGVTVTGDLGSTAKLELVLPPGVSVVGSSSGTFAMPIPEPRTYALMVAGLLFVALTVRRRPRN
jgi:hypothetical protein